MCYLKTEVQGGVILANKILVVDDEPAILNHIVETLTQNGFETYSARTSAEFKNLAITVRPDLIVLDLMLDNEMSMNAYNEILSVGFDAKIPILFVTGIADDHPPSHATPGRTYALLKKPFRLSELLTEINILMEGTSKLT